MDRMWLPEHSHVATVSNDRIGCALDILMRPSPAVLPGCLPRLVQHPIICYLCLSILQHGILLELSLHPMVSYRRGMITAGGQPS